MTEPHTLVCVPTTMESVPGAGRSTCRGCGVSVWVSAAMVAHLLVGKVRPTCLTCAQGVLRSPGIEAMIHPDQVSELRELGLLGNAQMTVNAVNRAARRRHGRQGRRRRARHQP